LLNAKRLAVADEAGNGDGLDILRQVDRISGPVIAAAERGED